MTAPCTIRGMERVECPPAGSRRRHDDRFQRFAEGGLDRCLPARVDIDQVEQACPAHLRHRPGVRLRRGPGRSRAPGAAPRRGHPIATNRLPLPGEQRSPPRTRLLRQLGGSRQLRGPPPSRPRSPGPARIRRGVVRRRRRAVRCAHPACRAGCAGAGARPRPDRRRCAASAVRRVPPRRRWRPNC